MEGKAWGYTGLCVGGIVCYSRCVPVSAGMATPSGLAKSFKCITCFGRVHHMKGAFAVLADNGLWGFG